MGFGQGLALLLVHPHYLVHSLNLELKLALTIVFVQESGEGIEA